MPAALLAACCKLLRFAMCDAFQLLENENIKPLEFVGGSALGVNFLRALTNGGNISINGTVAEMHRTDLKFVKIFHHRLGFVGLYCGLVV